MYNFIATTTFGLEATVKREVIKLGFENISVLDGRVNFSGDATTLVRANLWLRSADRVQLVMGEFKATTFEELFQGVKKLQWGDIIPINGNFIITGKSVKSTLSSVPACQSIVEKAVVEKLKEKYKIDYFSKSEETYKIQVSLLRDVATITIDTTGAGLHKRGYRANSVTAPLKETLAASLIELSYWRPDRVLLDPVCGSGTILIEAAMMGKNIAPGLNRRFVSEDWGVIPEEIWKEERKKAFEAINYDYDNKFYGSDFDPEAIKVAKENAIEAGVDELITFEVKPFKDVTLPCDYGVAICNPPYGERIGILEEVHQLYRDMGKLFGANDTWSTYVITSDEDFEKLYGKRANAKRKLFNGMIKTDYYQYYGRRPERNK